MEGNREVFFMKKKLSRLLCALLVMTMVLAMVPAVSAAEPKGTEDDPIIMYVGDYTSDYVSKAYGCNNSKHTTVLKYTEIFNGRETELKSSKYVSFDNSTGVFKATAATAKNGTFGLLKVEISCKDASCSYKPETVYMQIYAVATGITLRTSTGSTINSLSLPVDVEQRVYYTMSPLTANPDNVRAWSDNKNVEVLNKGEKDSDGRDAWGKDAYGTYFTLKATKGGIITKLNIELDGDTLHKSVTKEFDVLTGSAAVLTLKTGTQVLAQSNDDKDSYIDSTIGKTISITATADSVLGDVSDIDWDSSNPDVASFVSVPKNGKVDLKVGGAGTTKITATLGGKTATFEVRVLKDITSIAIHDTNGKTMDNQELTVGGDELTAKAVVYPTKYKESAKSAVWSIEDKDVLDFGDTYIKWVDPDTGKLTTETATFKAVGAGTTKVTVTLGNQTDSFRVTVKNAAKTIKISKLVNISNLSATVRNGSETEIVSRMNANSKFSQSLAITDENETIYVPVRWVSAFKASNGKTATVYGQLLTTDGEYNFNYGKLSTQITLTATLTDDAAVTDIAITANKDNAIENDVIRLTATPTVEPSSAEVKYQWYVNGKAVSGATKATLSYTIPKSSSDSATLYKFVCEVTASYKGTSTTSESKAFNVTVSRDYTVSVTTTSSKNGYTVGDKVEMKATLYYKGSAVSNSSFSWQLFDTNDNALDSGIATVTGNNATATVNTKGVKSAKGDKIVVRATVDYRGYSYSSSETITVNPAEAATVKQSVGSGAALKSSSIISAVTKAAGSSAKVSYIVFGSERSCKLTKSSSSSSSIGDTKCYVSTTSGQKLSDVYVKTSASSASVTYTAYDADDYVLATGTVSFDANDSDDTITSSGASFKAMAAVDQITEEYPEAEYVKLDLPRASEGKLYFDFNTISDFKREVKDSDKYYLNASSSQDDIEDVYFLPVYGVKGKITIDYTAYGSNNSDLGTGKITLSVKSKTASSKFTDVTASNVGSWAADSIDFCADNDLVNGKSTYSFAPKDNLTRGQLVAILYRAAGSPSVTGTTNPFNDVKTGDYYYNAVLWAYKNDVVNGTGAGKFSPNANVTREQIAAILYRFMGSPAATGSLSGYTDRSKISSWATTAMQWAIGKGYITGTSSTTLDPLGQATRAQAAVMLHRFLTK